MAWNRIDKKYIINAVRFTVVFVIFTIFDWVTKEFLFSQSDAIDPNYTNSGDYGIIGIRSYYHNNSTVFSFIKLDLPLYVHHILAFGMTSLLAIFCLFSPSTTITVGLGLIASGTMGNGMDRLMNDKVRDIIYTPFLDRGTFNFADVFIVVGALILVFGTFLYMLIEPIDEFEDTELLRQEFEKVDDDIEYNQNIPTIDGIDVPKKKKRSIKEQRNTDELSLQKEKPKRTKLEKPRKKERMDDILDPI